MTPFHPNQVFFPLHILFITEKKNKQIDGSIFCVNNCSKLINKTINLLKIEIIS